MNTATMPMPGALRWRALHPLADDSGACSLIYDLERAAVLEVPEELQLHVAPALETGDPDDALLSWLVQEDLITMEGWNLDGQPSRSAGQAFHNLDSASGMEGEAHVRIGGLSEEAALGALERAFRQTFGAGRVRLHLDWDGKFPGACLLEQIVFDASRLAAHSGQEVTFDLALAADQVTPAVSLFLSTLPVHVRLQCTPVAEGCAEAERALRLFWMEDLADRVTVTFVLAPGCRLQDLLAKARRLGVRHVDVVPPPLEYGAGLESWLRDYQTDLREENDAIVRELEAGTAPLDFRPVTRVVRRLMRSEPLARFGEDSLGGWPVADIPFQSETDSATCCSTCWARYLCRNSAALVAEGVAEERSAESCSVRTAECESAARLYHRLAQADPLLVNQAFGASAGLPDELPAAPASGLWGPQAPC